MMLGAGPVAAHPVASPPWNYVATSGITGTIAATTRRNAAALEGSVVGAAGTIAATTRRNVADFQGAVHPSGAFAATTRRDTLDIQGTVHPFPSGDFAAVTRRNTMAFEGQTPINGPFAAVTRRNTMAFQGISGELAIEGDDVLKLRRFRRKQVSDDGD